MAHGRAKKAKYMLINERLSCSCDGFWKPASTIQETTEYMVQLIVIWSGSVDYWEVIEPRVEMVR